jgi:hypothetical protein
MLNPVPVPEVRWERRADAARYERLLALLFAPQVPTPPERDR